MLACHLTITCTKLSTTPRLHRVAGLTGRRTAFITTQPCRAPHHTIADVGLIGGGQVPMPGEVSLAHHGVLFRDELPECRRHGLEVLRQPLEEGVPARSLHGRPGSQHVCGVSPTGDDHEGFGPLTVAAYDRGGYHASSVSPPPPL
jgi:hypothetical protein